MPRPSLARAERLARSPWLAAPLVAMLALIVFGRDLASEPFFADESAYLSQSYYAGLYASGRWNDPLWLDYPAYDLPPVPKYLIGASVGLAGYRPHTPVEAHYWYDGHTTTRFDAPGELLAARRPMVIVGAIGCLAIYGLGVVAAGRRVGLIAALLLMASPLYRLHARRAMSDVPCEASTLLALFFGLLCWKRVISGRSSWRTAGLLAVASGICAGLAVLSKLSGLLGLMILASWVPLAIAARAGWARAAGYAACVLIATFAAVLTFVALDPYLTTHPKARSLPPGLAAIGRLGFLERAKLLVATRFKVSADQKGMFKNDALHTPGEKLSVALVQGFGRFGPPGPSHSDSRKRFDRRQDGGLVVWLSLVAAGAIGAAFQGARQRRAGDPPTAWAFLAHFLVAFSVVTLYLPMAWDRYLLPIAAPSALLVAGLVGTMFEGARMTALRRSPPAWVFLILLGSYSYFWQERDWNVASRLMLTYALVDRGTVSIDGLEDQTHDRARYGGHYYSDKLPGFSLLATVPYAAAKWTFRLPDHPLDRRGFPYWPADYWVTLATSGVLTALTGALLARLARDLGCGPRRAALIGLAYGLATPAYVYATLGHGHQATAFALLASFALLWRVDAPRPRLRVGLAGFLAAYAAAIELQVGPVAAILGSYLLAQVIRGDRRPSLIGEFAVGAAIPTLLLLAYNFAAFGSPWDLGYFHHDQKEFAAVHSTENPLGLRSPHLGRVVPLLWGRHRGLLFYAPVVSLVPFGLAALALRRAWGVAIVSAAAMAAIFAVNVSYPEWTGGWSTGPRLLVPLLPFAMLAVAGFLASGRRWAAPLVAALAIAGGALMLAFIAVGGRIPPEVSDPLVQIVWPLWRGFRIEGIREPFARNPVGLIAPDLVRTLSPGWRWLQFLPLVVAQGVAIAAMLRSIRTGPDPTRPDPIRPAC